MKRIIKIVVILLLMIPIIIYGDTFERAKSRANKYLNGGAYADSYGKYLVSDINYSGNIPFDFKENGKLEVASGFVRAGFLSRYEYERTVISSDGNSNHQSYLFKGSKYWSITSSGSNKHYVIASGDEEDSKNNHVRVTEFVLPETEVTGKGSIEDPWVFVPKYKVSLYSNDTTMGVIDPNPNPDANTNNKYYRAGSSASIIIVSQPGYKYKSNESRNILVKFKFNQLLKKVNNIFEGC